MPAAAFVKSPARLVEQLRAMPPHEILRRQRAMAAARAELLYDVSESRVGTNFLRALAAGCTERRLADEETVRRCVALAAAHGHAGHGRPLLAAAAPRPAPRPSSRGRGAERSAGGDAARKG